MMSKSSVASLGSHRGYWDAAMGVAPVVRHTRDGGLDWSDSDLVSVFGVLADTWGHAYAKTYTAKSEGRIV